MVDPVSAQRLEAARLACGGQDGRTHLLGQRGGGQPDGRRAAADQQALPGLQVQAGGQRAVGGLDHLRKRAHHFPRQIGADRNHLRERNTGVLGVAAVVRAAHVTHHGDDLLPDLEAAARRGVVDDAGAFDAQYPRKAHSVPGKAQPGHQFGSVEPESLHPDPDPPFARGRQRKVAQDEIVHRTRFEQDDSAHRADVSRRRQMLLQASRSTDQRPTQAAATGTSRRPIRLESPETGLPGITNTAGKEPGRSGFESDRVRRVTVPPWDSFLCCPSAGVRSRHTTTTGARTEPRPRPYPR